MTKNRNQDYTSNVKTAYWVVKGSWWYLCAWGVLTLELSSYRGLDRFLYGNTLALELVQLNRRLVGLVSAQKGLATLRTYNRLTGLVMR